MSLEHIAVQMRRALPWSRRTSAVGAVHADAELRQGGVSIRLLRAGFIGPARTLFHNSEEAWIGWVELDSATGRASLRSEGTSHPPAGLTPNQDWLANPLPLASLMGLPGLCQAVDQHIPAAHRVRLPLTLDLGLASEGGVARWRVQYEVYGLGFRVLHLHAVTGATLYDKFDEWHS